MWCKNCEKESFSDICEICGEATESDIPSLVYWCDNCNIPLIHKANEKSKGTCSLCGKPTRYLCSDLRPVFPEERLLYEILTAKPFQYKECSVWANNNRYYINGKAKVFSMTKHETKDTEKIGLQLKELSANNDYKAFNEYIASSQLTVQPQASDTARRGTSVLSLTIIAGTAISLRTPFTNIFLLSTGSCMLFSPSVEITVFV